MIQLLFFGPVADRVQARALQLEHAAGMTLQQLIAQLDALHPHALDLVSSIAVNQMQVDDRSLVLHDHDEIAFMAKFSGG